MGIKSTTLITAWILKARTISYENALSTGLLFPCRSFSAQQLSRTTTQYSIATPHFLLVFPSKKVTQ